MLVLHLVQYHLVTAQTLFARGVSTIHMYVMCNAYIYTI